MVDDLSITNTAFDNGKPMQTSSIDNMIASVPNKYYKIVNVTALFATALSLIVVLVIILSKIKDENPTKIAKLAINNQSFDFGNFSNENSSSDLGISNLESEISEISLDVTKLNSPVESPPQEIITESMPNIKDNLSTQATNLISDIYKGKDDLDNATCVSEKANPSTETSESSETNGFINELSTKSNEINTEISELTDSEIILTTLSNIDVAKSKIIEGTTLAENDANLNDDNLSTQPTESILNLFVRSDSTEPLMDASDSNYSNLSSSTSNSNEEFSDPSQNSSNEETPLKLNSTSISVNEHSMDTLETPQDDTDEKRLEKEVTPFESSTTSSTMETLLISSQTLSRNEATSKLNSISTSGQTTKAMSKNTRHKIGENRLAKEVTLSTKTKTTTRRNFHRMRAQSRDFGFLQL